VKAGIGGPAARGHGSDGVVEGAPREDAGGPKVLVEHREHQAPGGFRCTSLVRIHCRDGVEAEWREPDDFHQHRHGVRRVLAAARTGARTRDRLELGKVRGAHLARGNSTNSLVDLTNIYVAASESP